MSPAAFAIRLVCLLACAIAPGAVFAHGSGRGEGQVLEWKTDQISQVVARGRTGRRVSVEGRDCLAGSILNFDVRDEYAFDIDETVWLDMELYVHSTGLELEVGYDRHVDAESASRKLKVTGTTSSRWFRQSVALERARFANLQHSNSDFTLATSTGRDRYRKGEFTICSLSLTRSYTTPVPRVFGWAAIEILDEHGRPTPSRMGIYDSAGRLQLPGDEALMLQNGSRTNRVVGLGTGVPPWPVPNRFVFYTDGRYRARLPVGEYDLIVAKGPEYRLARQRFTIRADATQSLPIELKRWTDMASQGWYSGDGHIHYARESTDDDRKLLLFAQGEDLHVANILRTGNSANTYFHQHDWKPVAAGGEKSFVLVPGQEDPRTGRRGHAMALNIGKPVRIPAHYLLYHEVFEQVRGQGGLAGYAHVVEAVGPPTARGMALDVPFGIVDFAEILSLHYVGADTWFDFLNLGFKLAPSAGTDYPGNVPGAVRSYVRIDAPFTPQAWFDGLKKGNTFVTSGPMLEFSINGHGMGSGIQLKKGEPLVIEARASMNPDIGALSSLELIEQGETLKAVTSPGATQEMKLSHEMRAQHGTWFVMRARGIGSVAALSAPIYVLVDGQSFWKPSAVPAIVQKLKLRMEEVLKPELADTHGWEAPEAWETVEANGRHWEAQQRALRERMEQATAIYDELARRAAATRNQ